MPRRESEHKWEKPDGLGESFSDDPFWTKIWKWVLFGPLILLNWLADWALYAFDRIALVRGVVSGVLAISVVAGVWGFLLEYEDRKEDRRDRREERADRSAARITQAWRVIIDGWQVKGNVGQRQALAFLIEKKQPLRGIKLDGAQLAGFDFSRAKDRDLSEASFNGATLEEALFGGVDLVRANFGCLIERRTETPSEANAESPPNTEDSRRCANLKAADLKGANLRLAKLEGAHLWLAKLIGADLQRANFEGAELYQADLDGAILFLANLKKAYLVRAILKGANLKLAKLEDAKLRSAKLQGAHLDGANLFRAKLEDANLEGTVLRLARLERALLSSAKLGGSNLREANFEGAILEGADLHEANLEGAKHLTHQQLDAACTSDQQPSGVPDGFPRYYKFSLKPCLRTEED